MCKPNVKLSFTVIALFIALAACSTDHKPLIKAGPPEVGSGQVVKVGQSKLILENKGEYVFIDIDAKDRERLKPLKKGEKVTLLGKLDPDKVQPNKKDGDNDADIYEVVRENGTHIRLKNQ